MRKIFIVALMFLLLLVSAPAFAENAGRIAFTKAQYTWQGFEESILRKSSTRGWWELYQRDICVIKPDGTEFMQLTDDGINYKPKWSLDGQKIAYCSGPPPSVSLYVMDPDGANKQELVVKQIDIYDFKWSPDSASILVFVKTRRSISPEEAWVVTVKDGGATKQMGSSEWARGWNHWGPQGANILNPDRRLMEGLPDGIAWPEWSPNGTYIAFIHNDRLAIADIATTGRPEKWRPSHLEPPCDRIGDWSTDSTKLLFFAAGNVCSINFDETGVTNLSMSRAEDACWNPDASQIAYTSADGRKGNSEIFIMDADGTGHIQLTNTNYFHLDLDWR